MKGEKLSTFIVLASICSLVLKSILIKAVSTEVENAFHLCIN